MINWIDVEEKLPKEYRVVLISFSGDESKGLPSGMSVGYLRHPAGVKSEHFFVTPGMNQPGDARLWADLGDDFEAPLWTMNKPNAKKRT